MYIKNNYEFVPKMDLNFEPSGTFLTFPVKSYLAKKVRSVVSAAKKMRCAKPILRCDQCAFKSATDEIFVAHLTAHSISHPQDQFNDSLNQTRVLVPGGYHDSSMKLKINQNESFEKKQRCKALALKIGYVRHAG